MTGSEEGNCILSHDFGNVTNGTFENATLCCVADNLPVPANAIVLPSCGVTYQSQCTISCDEGFTGDDVTYLCNVTSDPTMVNWVAINNTVMDHECQRGVFVTIS